jgi:hypothetical protein
MIAACEQGDIRQLTEWGRQGFRCTHSGLLWHVIRLNNLDVLRCLVKELGADINLTMQDGARATVLHFVSQEGNLQAGYGTVHGI